MGRKKMPLLKAVLFFYATKRSSILAKVSMHIKAFRLAFWSCVEANEKNPQTERSSMN